MEQILKNYKGVILFYLIIIISALIICARMENLNKAENVKEIHSIAAR